MVYNV